MVAAVDRVRRQLVPVRIASSSQHISIVVHILNTTYISLSSITVYIGFNFILQKRQQQRKQISEPHFWQYHQ